MKFFKDEDYFKKKTLQACYWAGFIAADGHIEKRGNYSCLKIELSVLDKEHLELFKNQIEFSGNIKERFRKDRPEYHTVYLQVNAKVWSEDLLNIFNIGSNKTFDLKPPIGLDKCQEMAYIIGLLDGDGCIKVQSSKNNKGKYIYVIFTSSSNDMLKWVEKRYCNFLEQENLKVCKWKNNNSKNSYSISVGGNNAKKLLKLLDEIDLTKLERKWYICKTEGINQLDLNSGAVKVSKYEFEKIKKLRENFSVAEISGLYKVSKSTIRRIINNERIK